MSTDTPHAPADGPQPAARPLADVMRELADRYDADVPGYPRGVVMVQAETVRAWADRIEVLEAALDESDWICTSYAEHLDEHAPSIADMLRIDKLRAKADAIRAVLGIAD
jgi:hypothetical protein